MKLAIDTGTGFFDVRDLSKAEIEECERHKDRFVEALNALAPLRFAHRNFQEWSNYITRLLRGEERPVSEKEELDRLLMNYLTTVYASMEHYKKVHHRIYRKDEESKQRYSKIINRLCNADWHFAFILDLRGYAQHVKLPISRYSRKESQTSITITIEADSVELTQNSRDWKHSTLKPDRGNIALVPALRRFHIQLMQSYGSFVANQLFPRLQDADSFFGRLAAEANRHRAGRMIFLEVEHDSGSSDPDAPRTIRPKITEVPNDVYAEIGLNVPPRDYSSSPPTDMPGGEG